MRALLLFLNLHLLVINAPGSYFDMSHNRNTIDLEMSRTVNDMARRLGTLRFFLDASHELLILGQLSKSDFQRHSPQVCTIQLFLFALLISI